jgi:hypothetical protein
LFDVLEIEGKRAFTYTTRYFDDVERSSYFDHLQRRRKRGKVRVRHYVDAGFSYLEVKLKEQRATTSKRRLSVDKPLTTLDGCLFFQHYKSDDVTITLKLHIKSDFHKPSSYGTIQRRGIGCLERRGPCPKFLAWAFVRPSRTGTESNAGAEATLHKQISP